MLRPGVRRPQIGALPTAQQKIISVAQKTGAGNIENEQGSTRVLYDTLPLDGNTIFNFFANPQASRNTLGTTLGSNVDSNQGLLGPGETLAIEYVSFQWVRLSAASPNASVTGYGPVSSNPVADVNLGFYNGNFQILLANQVILKPLGNSVFQPEFNYTITGAFNAEVFKMMTKAAVMPNLQLAVQVTVPTYATQAATFNYLRCTIQGVGSILNLRETV